MVAIPIFTDISGSGVESASFLTFSRTQCGCRCIASCFLVLLTNKLSF